MINQRLYVDEIFYGLQGEGNRMGFPSIFIRTGGCNLTCEGFKCKLESPKKPGFFVKGCDTIHAVNIEHFKETWTSYDNFNDVIRKVQALIPENMPYNEEKVDIVFTGGEPLLHHKNHVMLSLVEYYLSRGHKVWFETNGTIPIDFKKFPVYKKVSMSMSVKMSVSGEQKFKRWKPSIPNSYLMNTNDSYFKFVLSAESIEEGAKEILEFLAMIPTYGPVYCMPLGATEDEVSENAYAVYEFALKQGLRYSDRLHIRIHNDKRGV